MHFSGVVAIRFKELYETISDDGDCLYDSGFTIVIGCNAMNIRNAFDIILSAAEDQANQIVEQYDIEQIELQHIEIDDWDEDVLASIKSFDREVYYVSSKIFFKDDDAYDEDESEEEEDDDEISLQ